jgi:hypothetical protein
MHAHAIAHHLNLNARESSSALRNTLTAWALDLVFYTARETPRSAHLLYGPFALSVRTKRAAVRTFDTSGPQLVSNL